MHSAPQSRTFRIIPLTAAVAAALALSACDRPRDGTAGTTADTRVAQVENKGAQAADSIRDGAGAARDNVAKAADATTNKVKDAAITASINAELARDNELKATRIDVDTQDGRVALSGTAPSTVARDHASQLAQKVDGVVSVDNRLEVKAP